MNYSDVAMSSVGMNWEFIVSKVPLDRNTQKTRLDIDQLFRGLQEPDSGFPVGTATW
jgi:hypothetical protein